MGDTSGQTPSDSSPPPPTDQSSAPPPQQSSPSPPPPDASSPPPSSPPPSSPSPPPPSESPPASSPPPPEQSTTPSPPAPAETTTSTKASPPPPTFKAPASGTTSTPSRPAAVPSTTKSPVTSGSVQSAPSPPSSSNTKGFIIGGLVCGIFIIVMIVVMVACLKKKKKKYYEPPPPLKGDQNYRNWNSSPPKDYIVQLDPGHQPKSSWDANNEFASPRQPMSPMNIGPNQSSFSYEQLAAATSGFSQDNILGQGGFGYVHKGVLPNGKEIAVKSLKSGSGQGEREFQAEVEIISRVHHRHLVSLVGYCIADGQRMLVYEFVPNKTLEFHLHGKGQPVMSWATRMRIALGASKGLAYLHEDCHPRIIHRDIKAANILLDNNFEAMVADFGLAKLSTDNNTHVSTRVMGTFGYLAPEYAASGKLTDKSDVFSFGVMLLEIITGRKPVDRSSNYMDDSLVDWARPLLGKALENRNYDGIVDTLLENEYDADEMARMVACAAASIRHSAKMRPKMIQIVRALEGDSSLDEIIAGPKPVQNSISSNDSIGTETGLYDTGAYNADMMKFREMVLTNNTVASSEFGGTSEYGLNPSYTSSDVSDLSVERRHKM